MLHKKPEQLSKRGTGGSTRPNPRSREILFTGSYLLIKKSSNKEGQRGPQKIRIEKGSNSFIIRTRVPLKKIPNYNIKKSSPNENLECRTPKLN